MTAENILIECLMVLPWVVGEAVRVVDLITVVEQLFQWKKLRWHSTAN